jgi:hypothetical protein
MYKIYPQYREILRMIMAAVGRGGEGDVGQRIRDEILVIQVKLMVLGIYLLFLFIVSLNHIICNSNTKNGN